MDCTSKCSVPNISQLILTAPLRVNQASLFMSYRPGKQGQKETAAVLKVLRQKRAQAPWHQSHTPPPPSHQSPLPGVHSRPARAKGRPKPFLFPFTTGVFYRSLNSSYYLFSGIFLKMCFYGAPSQRLSYHHSLLNQATEMY